MLKAIHLESFDERVFSYGTDFKTMAYNTKRGKTGEVLGYIDRLFDFANYMAGYTKPLIVSLEGKLKNSAIPVYGNLPLVYLKGDVTMEFNSISYNCVPHCGESYMLSRMPHEIGLYIALTGKALEEGDILNFGIAKERKVFTKADFWRLSELVKQAEDLVSFDCGYEPYYKHTLSKKEDANNMIREFYARSETEGENNVLFDLFYRKKMIENANLLSQVSNDNDKRFEVGSEDNHHFSLVGNNLKTFEKMFMGEIGVSETDATKPLPIYQNRHKIAELFSKPTLDEIISGLEQDGGELALDALAAISHKSKPIAEIVFKMMKEAQNKTYAECLETEYNVMRNMVQHEKLAQFVFTTERFAFDFSEQEVEQIVEGNPQKLPFAIDKNDFLPVKHYYNNYPEAFISYLSNVSLRNPEVLRNFDKIVATNLYRLGLDHLNPTFSKKMAKEKLQDYNFWMQKVKTKTERIEELVCDIRLARKYLDDRQKEIETFFGDADFEKKLDGYIKTAMDSLIEDDLKAMEGAYRGLSYMERTKVAKEINNIFAKGRFSSDSSKHIVGGAEQILDIGNTITEMPKRVRDYLDYDKFKSKFSKEVKLDPERYADYLKGHIDGFRTELKVNTGDKLELDATALNTPRGELMEKAPSQHKDLPWFILEEGLPEVERRFRAKLINRIIKANESAGGKLDKAERDKLFGELYSMIYGDDFEGKNLRDFMYHLTENTIDFNMKVPEAPVPVEASNMRIAEKDETPQFNDNINRVDEYVDYFQNETSMQFNAPDTSPKQASDALSFITSSLMLKSEHRRLFDVMARNAHQPLVSSLLEKAKDIFNRRSHLLEDNSKQSDTTALGKAVNAQLYKERANALVAHTMFNFCLKALDELQVLFELFGHLEKGRPHAVTQTLQEHGFKVTSDKEAGELLSLLDYVLFCCLDIYNDFRFKVALPEDVLKRDYDKFLGFLYDASVLKEKNENGFVNTSLRLFLNRVEAQPEADKTLLEVFDGISQDDTMGDKLARRNRVVMRNTHTEDVFAPAFDNLKRKSLMQLDEEFTAKLNELKQSRELIDESIEEAFHAPKHSHRKPLLDEFYSIVGGPQINTSENLIHHIRRHYLEQRNRLIELKRLAPFGDFSEESKPDEASGLDLMDTELRREFSRGITPYITELQRKNALYVKGHPTFMDMYYLNMNRKNTRIPEAFSELDHRQSAATWFETKLILHLRKLMGIKRSLEPQLTNHELSAVDRIIRRLLDKDELRRVMYQKLVAEKYTMNFYRNSIVASNDDVATNVAEARKTDLSSVNPDISIKNEEAIKQAISLMLSIRSQSHAHRIEHDRAYEWAKQLIEKAKSEPVSEPDADKGAEETPLSLGRGTVDHLRRETTLTALSDMVSVGYDQMIKRSLDVAKDFAKKQEANQTLKEELKSLSNELNK